MIQYPSKFDMILAPLVKIEKNFIGYIFILYSKENVADTRSLMNGYVNQLEKLIPVYCYYEIKSLPSGVSEVKAIFTLPKCIYKTRDKGTIYNGKNIPPFHALIVDTWYNNIIKSECNFIPKPMIHKKDHHFIPNIPPFKGDIELLNKARAMLVKKFLGFAGKQTHTMYLKNITDSYFEAYKKFKRFDTFIFMVKMPKSNIHDEFITQSLEYEIGCVLTSVSCVNNSLNGIKGNYELYLHVPSSIVEGKWDKPFTFKNIEYGSLFGLIKNQWEYVLLGNGLLEEDNKGELLIGENPAVLEQFDFKTKHMNDFIDQMEITKKFVNKTFIKTN